jgi:hypothetical protein
MYHSHSFRSSLLVLFLFLLVGRTADAQERRPVGKAALPKEPGTLLQREAAGKAWKALGLGNPVHSGDLLLTLPGGPAALVSNDDTVMLRLWGNLPELTAHPLMESAVVLHATPDFALDFTLDRGGVVLTNQRDKGPAKVRVRVRKETWDLTLAEPGSSVAVELYGRWPRGVPFDPNPKSSGEPTAAVTFEVLKGQVDLKVGAQQHALKAPPGPAAFHWDSVGGADGPQRREKPPAWLAGPTTAEGKAARAAVGQALNRFSDLVKQKAAPEALADLLAAADRDSDADRARLTRRVAVHGLGALDDLPRLFGALEDAKHPDVRATAVEALRHWIGRAPGQDQALYQFLLAQPKLPKSQAETVLQLLHSPGGPALLDPLTYEVLIAYLGHERLAVRELARWQLARLLRGGSKVAFDAAAPAGQREKAVGEFKELVREALKKPKPGPARR